MMEMEFLDQLADAREKFCRLDADEEERRNIPCLCCGTVYRPSVSGTDHSLLCTECLQTCGRYEAVIEAQADAAKLLGTKNATALDIAETRNAELMRELEELRSKVATRPSTTPESTEPERPEIHFTDVPAEPTADGVRFDLRGAVEAREAAEKPAGGKKHARSTGSGS